MPAEFDTSQPLLVDHYEVERILGSGAMGVVYLARDVRIGRYVALKTLHRKASSLSDESAEQHLSRFRREAELCGSLIHPNIVALHEVGYESRRFTYLAMEYIDGESIQSMLRRLGSLPVDAAIRVADDVLQALAYAHERGVIHRDLKPANILMTLGGQAKLTDFGVARAGTDSDLTARGQLLGTPHYMAPEQIVGAVLDPRSDLFSLGVVLFELLTGNKPFDGTGLTDVLYNVVNQPAPPITLSAREAPLWFAGFVERLLEKQPEERFPSAATALRELRRLRSLDTQANGVEIDAADLPMVMPALRVLTADDTPTTPIVEPPVVLNISHKPARKRWVNREVSRTFAFALIGAMLTVVGGAVLGLTRQIQVEPNPAIDTAALSQKQMLMREAHTLYNAGAYQKSYHAYSRYLELYPWSPAATEGRERSIAAQRLLEEMTTVATAEIDVKASPGRSSRTAAIAQSSLGAEMAVGEIERDDFYVASVATPSRASEQSTKEQARESIWSRMRRALGRR